MPQTTTQSETIMARARELMPGGVNSPVRAFRGVGGAPRVIREGSGPFMIDADGNEYVDYIGSWGPLILGHAHPAVVRAVTETAARGTSFGCPTELENEMATLIVEMVPSIEMVRMVNSGTEAAMAILRLARGYTGRPKIVKMAGCYHGHADSLLVKAGSGVATLGLPDSPGVTPAVAADTVTVPYNCLETLRTAMEQNDGQIAAILVEPIAGNMGCIPPREDYLKGLRATADEFGALLIFDEVMTGFRVAPGGAQALYGVTPDVTMLGKVVGGGLPCAAYGGRREIMEKIAPAGPVYQAGTLSGNPLAMAAGAATLRLLKEGSVYETLETQSAKLAEGLKSAAAEAGAAIYQTRVGSMLGLFFQEGPVYNFDDACRSDTERYGKYFHAMLERGVYLAPSQFEAAFVSAAHDDAALERTIEAAREAMRLI